MQDKKKVYIQESRKTRKKKDEKVTHTGKRSVVGITTEQRHAPKLQNEKKGHLEVGGWGMFWRN